MPLGHWAVLRSACVGEPWPEFLLSPSTEVPSDEVPAPAEKFAVTWQVPVQVVVAQPEPPVPLVRVTPV